MIAVVVAPTSQTRVIRRCLPAMRTQTLPEALATSIAPTRSRRSSPSSASISSTLLPISASLSHNV